MQMSSIPAPEVDFGKAAEDYGRHRQGFPDVFFDRLAGLGLTFSSKRILDVGTGTGLFARELASRGGIVTGIDQSADLLAEAERANLGQLSGVTYLHGVAENTGLAPSSFDIITAATCWHWFDRPQAASEAVRLLRTDGCLLICHLDWWRGRSGVIELTTNVVRSFSPSAEAAYKANTFQYPAWLSDLRRAGFLTIDVLGFTTSLRYSHEGWIGRVKASASVGPVLSSAEIAAFEREFSRKLAELDPSPEFNVEHFAFAVLARR
jgi:SAM-dependent methyltransferase